MRSSITFKVMLVGIMALMTSVIPSLAHAQPSADLAVTLAGQTSLDQFVQALDTAGLTDTLRADGPFTVWAPTDAAFARLSPATRQRLQDPAVLKQVLQYSVAPGVVTAAQLIQVRSIRTVEGEQVTISATNGSVRINQSNVVQRDLAASNGIIHVVDALLIPPSLMDSLPDTGSVETSDWPLVLVILGIALGGLGTVLRIRRKSYAWDNFLSR